MVNISKIRTLASERGVKLSFIVERLGLKSRTYFQDLEKRRADITDDRLSIIAEILDTSIDYLRDETDDPTPKQKSPTSWRDMDMSIEKRNFFEELDKLSDEQILSLSRIIFPIIDEIKANRKERQ